MPGCAANTWPRVFVLRSEEVTPSIAKFEVVATPPTVRPPLTVEVALAKNPLVKVWSNAYVFAVVVPNAIVNAPVAGLYWSGYRAESDELEILLLKVLM